jgi:hypothetical protein
MFFKTKLLMRRIFQDVIFLFYRHYNGGGTKSIAYESAIISVAFLILIHILQIKVLLWGGGVTIGDSRLLRFLSISIYFVPVYFLLSYFFTRQETSEYQFTGNLKKGYLFLVFYLVISFSTLSLIILFKKNLI